MNQRIKTFLAGGLLAVALSGAAVAGQYEDGLAAFQVWQPLADGGNAEAQFDVGMLYYAGVGAPQNYSQAALWFRKAADQGQASAQAFLGKMYADGHGVRRDYAQALIWLREAASQGGAAGQSFLGALYADGRGVPQDYVQAHMWFNLAASGASAGELHDGAVMARDTMAAKMTPAQIAEAQRLASEWVPKK
jgi:uncharacterized protein